jgi:membrane protease YdiL (CAAX protease family)
MAVDSDRSTGENWRAGFSGGLGPLLAVLLAISLLVLGANVAESWLLGGEASTLVGHLTEIPPFALVGGIAWLALRREGTGLRDIGASRELLAPALAAFAALVVAVNLAALALALRGGGTPAFGFIYDGSPALVAAAVVNTYLFNGLAEELLTRGYLQNKLVVLLDGVDERVARATGVLGASALFAVLHVPTLLQQGVAPSAIPLGLLPLLLTGVAFGVIYEVTRNLYLVALLHGIGNYWLLFVDPGPWPNWPVIMVLYAGLVVGYRAWAGGTDRRTVGVAG